MKFRFYLGPTHTILAEPIRSLNPDGSIELYDGRRLNHCRHDKIEFEHDWTERDTGVLWSGSCGKFIIDVLPPAVRVRPAYCGRREEYRFIDGNWYWMLTIGDKLHMLWYRWSPWAWTRRYGL